MNSESERDQIMKAYTRRARMLTIGCAALILAFAFLSVQIHLPRGSFLIFVLVLAVFHTVARLAIGARARAKLRNGPIEQMSEWERKTLQKNIRRVQFLIVLLAVALVVGLLQLGHAPLELVLASAAINIFIQIFLVQTTLRLRKRLAFKPDPDAAANPPQVSP